MKWVPSGGLHLTLKFLGEVEDARVGELRAALGVVARAAGGRRGGVTLAIGGCGVFPDFARPRVIWAGVEPDPALELLQHAVEQAFAPLGFPIEGRPFRPHLTLGRAERSARPRDFAGLEEALASIAFAATVVVEDVDLMQSTLQPKGAVYQVDHRERLL